MGSQNVDRTKLRWELDLLCRAGFRGLVTYGSIGIMAEIPQMARQAGFDGTIIMGVWDPPLKEEIDAAVSASKMVDGYCIGNEGLGIRYTQKQLAATMKEVRDRTGRPVTTSEPIDSYLSAPLGSFLIEISDWIFPLAHPYWASQMEPKRAVEWIVVRHDYLASTSEKTLILKEAGFPTAGSPGCNELLQKRFFKELRSTDLAFFYFEAFDQPWKGLPQGEPEEEAYWGLFSAAGQPKKALDNISAPTVR